ncbi:MAG: hypothetical protein B7733_26190 [Myxococcales bacterium FL481]|nr:MAG: hypothetical protein B7733_26190 [Myxococcales bacterium FL481]
MASRLATWLVVALVVVAGLEILTAARVYGSRISPQDWEGVDNLIDDDMPLWTDPAWLRPAARQHLTAARSDVSVGAPDLMGWPRFRVLSLAGTPAWSATLRRELGDDRVPQVHEEHIVGGLALRTYDRPDVPIRLDDLVAHRRRLSPEAFTSLRQSTCRRHGDGWRCGRKAEPVATVSFRVVEVTFQPRHCLALEFDQPATIELNIADMQLGDSLRGHVGLADFNARLRTDAPTVVRLSVAGDTVMQRNFTDDEGWAAFVVHTVPQVADVRVQIERPDHLTWHRGKARDRPRPVVCFELRSLGEARP